ncbi:aldehyde dehydrogenase [Alisedimentitalea sp. MJ-SS2]|uniref:aldehyde dehydrogenase n=1 Tax=Aliisedimentitalea sp. MJ-SS2 TaxID=3049795 RepID=UPI00290C5B4B|nr:aldehyde dehydrogenase [Alisedimentitalea sp. MJ-SS2]MDU8929525.1 aldehyde dehydrogenase [Alisedimentitalea sp. MJ-SS2]
MTVQERINALREKAIAEQKLFIDGKWVDGEGEPLEVVSPIDGQVLTTAERASAADVNRAVAAARQAFEDGRWSKMAPAGRKKVLHRIADLIEERAIELTVLGVRDNGTEFNMAIKAEAGSAAGTFRYYAEAVDKIYGEVAPTSPDVLGLVHKTPVGVVGAIVPWNFPLMIGAWKLAPALATGNSVVLKPAETASLSLLNLAEICAEAGLPDGVLNVVTGQGSVTGEAIAMSMDVDVLVFTGSGGVGRRLLEYSAASNLKRVYLELGGKSPNIVFADAPDLEKAAAVSAAGIFRNSGQVCVAGSRLLVERSIHDEFVDALSRHAAAFKVGDPLDLTSQIGAVNSMVQLEGNLGFVSDATAQGAELALGGGRILESTGGYYMEPTVLTGVKPDDRVFREEVFGPVLAVTAFDSDEEAIALANGTDYGLSAGVWTGSLSRTHKMVAGIRSGIVHVNTYGGSDNTVPLGGVKQSGNGHDKSMHAIEKYLDLKTAWIQL